MRIQITKEEVSIAESIAYTNSQGTSAMCLSTLYFYSD